MLAFSYTSTMDPMGHGKLTNLGAKWFCLMSRVGPSLHFQPPPCHDKKNHRGNQWILGHPHPLFVWCANPVYRCSHIIIAYIYIHMIIYVFDGELSLNLPFKPQCRSWTIGMINIRTGSDLACYPFPHSYEMPPNENLDFVLDLFLWGICSD